MIDVRVIARDTGEAVAIAIALGVCSVWWAKGARLKLRDYWREYVGT